MLINTNKDLILSRLSAHTFAPKFETMDPIVDQLNARLDALERSAPVPANAPSCGTHRHNRTFPTLLCAHSSVRPRRFQAQDRRNGNAHPASGSIQLVALRGFRSSHARYWLRYQIAVRSRYLVPISASHNPLD